jgi:hypothetical protein
MRSGRPPDRCRRIYDFFAGGEVAEAAEVANSQTHKLRGGGHRSLTGRASITSIRFAYFGGGCGFPARNCIFIQL